MFGETSSSYLGNGSKEAGGPLGEMYGSVGSRKTCLSQNYSGFLARYEVGFERSLFQSKGCSVWRFGSNGLVLGLSFERFLSSCEFSSALP